MGAFLITLAVFVAAFVALSLGLLFGRGPIRGSCGGLACIPGTSCATCTRRKEEDA